MGRWLEMNYDFFDNIEKRSSSLGLKQTRSREIVRKERPA